MGCRDGFNEVVNPALTRFECLGWACPNLTSVLDKSACQATNVGEEPQDGRCGLEVQAVQGLRLRAEHERERIMHGLGIFVAGLEGADNA